MEKDSALFLRECPCQHPDCDSVVLGLRDPEISKAASGRLEFWVFLQVENIGPLITQLQKMVEIKQTKMQGNIVQN